MNVALHTRFWLKHLLHYKLHWLLSVSCNCSLEHSNCHSVPGRGPELAAEPGPPPTSLIPPGPHSPEKNLCTSSVEQDQGSPRTFTTYPSLLSELSITLGVRLCSVSASVVARKTKTGPLRCCSARPPPAPPQSARRPPWPVSRPSLILLCLGRCRLTHSAPLPPPARALPLPRTHTWWGSALVLGLRA